ncbi:MAG TPA: glycine zipper 2TM domain-containing protein [Xanthomonadaceae bacterium]|nr:glycine zipper 2TM domain-containing protein [Xanthomonadaceae bacterium]
MKRALAATLAIAGLSVGGSAIAEHEYDGRGGFRDAGAYYDYAEVLSVDPVIDYIREPATRRECWEEPVYYRRGGYYRDRDRTPGLVGAIVGGVIGNQFGSGRGRDAATVYGAALGYSAARDAQRDRYYYGGRPYRTYETRCDVRRDYRPDERVVGYEVTYDYNGQIGRVRTSHHPGDTIRVRVNVDPIP